MASGGGKYLMVAALDFGTTYSGYAFSFKHDFKTDPLKIQTNPVWKSGGHQFMSLKTSTCLLLTKEQEFHAFGFEAEELYADAVMAEDQDQDDYLFFQHFKMNLHNNKNITTSMRLEDITGKTSIPAITIFKLSIKALVDHLKDEIKKQKAPVENDEICWVLTVPAIWTDIAKEFMRISAEDAGIKREHLLLALEPEAASIYCQFLSIEKQEGSEPGFTMTKTDTEYMVVDLGGGTADLTVHRKAAENTLDEIHRVMGNDCGGISINKEFLKILEDIVGSSVLDAIKEKAPVSYLSFIREFESIKRTVNTEEKDLKQKKKGVNMTFPIFTFDKFCQKCHTPKQSFEDLLQSSQYKADMKLIGDKLRMAPSFARNLFKQTIENIVELMRAILSKPEAKNVSHILLVGGFADCNLVQDAIHKSFPNMKIVVPEDAGLAVLKGAVLFGHRPDYIHERVMKCTYGLMTNVPWDGRKYKEKYRILMSGEERCDKVFSPIVHLNQTVAAGETIKKALYTPDINQKEMIFHVYTTDQYNASYVDEAGCNLLCNPKLTFEEPVPEIRWVDVEFILGNTEIGLKAVDRLSGKSISAEWQLI